MVKKANVAEDEPISRKWSWRPEMDDKAILLGKGDVTVNQILDQKEAANDLSDYLFYMTSGQILHAFVNGELIGSQWSKNGGESFVFEQNVKLNHKKNTISLLSATVGFRNSGANFDLAPSGITGPVELIGYHGDDEVVVKDLSSQKWSYKIGLEGLNQELYSSQSLKWQEDSFPVNRTLTWYHVPRSFLNDNGDNTLVLFEEFGGNPSSVNFQTIAIGSACISAEENRKIELSCQGRPISAFKFASFGNPQGACGSFVKGYCEGSKDALSVVEKACVGKESCTIDVSEDTFGSTTCGDDVIKTLSVEAIC
ncbi:hypothetical protein POTOM_000203 [Populus tomentosa]|uniref:SUEL-type lectin domain-containing protein n=1 Tax=Populus tomentosa TaxID=118781 RepID=A0A8X8DFP2_POPTO|nr:hypothetical protein POTOM_000203 [Populus tomentosa]